MKQSHIEQSLRRLQMLLAEAGYQIFTPIQEYVRSNDDFIAIDREFGHLFLFRSGVNGVEVRRRHDPISKPMVIATLRDSITSNLRQRHFLPDIDFDEWSKWIDPSEHDGFQEALRQSNRKWIPDGRGGLMTNF